MQQKRDDRLDSMQTEAWAHSKTLCQTMNPCKKKTGSAGGRTTRAQKQVIGGAELKAAASHHICPASWTGRHRRSACIRSYQRSARAAPAASSRSCCVPMAPTLAQAGGAVRQPRGLGTAPASAAQGGLPLARNAGTPAARQHLQHRWCLHASWQRLQNRVGSNA